MSKLFSKLCFFKLKYPTIPPSPEHHHHTHNNKQDSSSLYDVASSSAHSTTFKSIEEDQLDLLSSSSDSDTWDHLPPPDFATVISSHRFFFSSPGRSNSIVEYTRPCSHCNRNSNITSFIPKGGVGVTKNSLDPYLDFRRSMQEMIDSRESSVDVRRDWEYLHDLLLCYLALNNSHNHKYIVRAFTDLVVDLLSSQSPQPPSPELKASHCRKLNGRRQGCFSGPLV